MRHTIPSSSPRGPWAIRKLLLFVGLALVTSGVAAAGAAAQVDSGGDEPVTPAVEVTQVVPDLVVAVDPGPVEGLGPVDGPAVIDRLARDLDRLALVEWVAPDRTVAPGPNLLVGLEEGREAPGLSAVRQVVAAQPEAAAIEVGGRVVSDVELLGRYDRALAVVIVLAALALGGLVAWLGSPRHGLAAGGVVAASGALSAVGGRSSVADFDGSLVTSAVPAVLAALLVSSFIALRLLQWFTRPRGEDLAEMIQLSLRSLALEAGLLVAGLVVTTLFLGLIDPGRSPAVGVFGGTLTALLLTAAVMAPALAALEGAGWSVDLDGRDDTGHAARLVLGSRPSVRELPIWLLLAGGFAFGFLALVAVTGTPDADLVDGSDVSSAQASAARLAESGGDPTSAIAVSFPTGTDQQVKSAWLLEASQLPSVGRVDTSTARFVAGAEVPVDGSPLGPLSAVLDGTEAPTHALVVPVVSARSEAARDLVGEIRGIDPGLDVGATGTPVGARTAAERDRSVVWITVTVLTLVAAAIVYGVAGDPLVAAVAGGLRLLDALALIGLYHLVGGSVDGPALILAVFLVSIAVGLYEVGTIRRLMVSPRIDDDHDRVTDTLDHEGWAAATALAVVAVAALGFLGAGVGSLARDGVVLTLGLLVVLIAGVWLLRPAVLADRVVRSVVRSPVRHALQVLVRSEDQGDQQARWHEVVGPLLAAEFRFQIDPATAAMGQVFVDDTPVFDSAVAHHRSLVQAGLRVTGRDPVIRSVRAVTEDGASSLLVVVDHPVRRLIDGEDKVVGVRRPERRTLLLWLREVAPGHHRIADLVEVGTEPLTPAEPSPPPAVDPTFRLSVDHGAG